MARTIEAEVAVARHRAIQDTIDALVASGALGEDSYDRIVAALKTLGWEGIPARSFAATRVRRETR